MLARWSHTVVYGHNNATELSCELGAKRGLFMTRSKYEAPAMEVNDHGKVSGSALIQIVWNQDIERNNVF